MTFSTALPDAPADPRLGRFVDAARDLANETGSAVFTVQQVVERAGLSLKSFYRCFRGKDDLLLALLEEESRTGAELLREMVEQHGARPDRLRAFVDGIFSLAVVPGAEGYAGVLAREHRRLAEVRPDELRRALAPLVDLLAAEIGVLPHGDPTRDADIVFGLLIAGIHDVTVGRADAAATAAHLWEFCWNGLGGAPCR